MIKDNTCSKISELCLRNILLATQNIHMEEIPIIKGVSLHYPHMIISENTQPHILETCLDDDTIRYQDAQEESKEKLSMGESYIHTLEGEEKKTGEF